MLKTDGYHFVYSSANEMSQGGVGLLIKNNLAKHILNVQSISSRILLGTLDCYPKLTIFYAYSPKEKASVIIKGLFCRILAECLHDDIPLHQFLVKLVI